MRTRNQGYSLVELIIGLGLMALIAYFSADFLRKNEQATAELSARSQSQKTLQLLQSFLDKDMKFREQSAIVALCSNPLCLNFSIQRLATGGSQFTVSYQSACRALPAGKNLVNLDFRRQSLESAAIAGLTNFRSICMQAMDCPLGQAPALTITTSNVAPGASIPHYPPSLPDLNISQGNRSLVAAAVCAYPSTQETPGGIGTPVSQNRVILEAAYLGTNQTIRLERKELSYSSSNVAGVQYLPN